MITLFIYIFFIMQKNFQKSRKGFLLIELSIALVVIGLLFAGISGGTALIENAKINSTISQLNSLKNAIQVFTNEYGLPPGGLTNTLNYFENSMYQDNATNPHTCLRTGNEEKIAAEGTANTQISGQKTAANTEIKPISWTNGVATVKTTITYSSIALCQLHASKHVDLGKNSIVSINNMVPGVNAPAAKIAGQSSIIFITNTIDHTQNLMIGNANNTTKWDGTYEKITGNVPGTILSKLDRKISTGEPETGALMANKTDFDTSTTKCDYKDKKPECIAKLNLSH